MRQWIVLGLFIFLIVALMRSGGGKQHDFSIPSHDDRIRALEQKVFGSSQLSSHQCDSSEHFPHISGADR
jgi:hypothetical protein